MLWRQLDFKDWKHMLDLGFQGMSRWLDVSTFWLLWTFFRSTFFLQALPFGHMTPFPNPQ